MVIFIARVEEFPMRRSENVFLKKCGDTFILKPNNLANLYSILYFHYYSQFLEFLNQQYRCKFLAGNINFLMVTFKKLLLS